ncbi:MAG: AEC family transporter [Halanaerobiaceae bacterium]
MTILNALQSVITILLMISIGFILSKKEWLNEATSKLFAKIVINISLPALMVYNLMTSFSKDELINLMGGIIVPFTGIALSYLLSIPVSKILQIKPERRGLFRALFAFSNTIFVGLPVNIALFGEKSVPMVTLYYIANTTLFWTIGVYGIRGDTAEGNGGIFSVDTIKRIFSPILLAYIFSILLILLEIKLPNFLLDTCKYMSQMTTPLSMLIIGTIIYSIDISGFRIDRDVVVLLIGRFLITPLLIYYIFTLFNGPVLMGKVFVVEAAMPVMTTIAIVGHAYGADHKYATFMVTISTVASLLIIPLFMLFLG